MSEPNDDTETVFIGTTVYIDFDCGIKDFEAGRVVDLDIALNEPPPEDKA